MLAKCLFIFDVIKDETIKKNKWYKFYFCKMIKWVFHLLFFLFCHWSTLRVLQMWIFLLHLRFKISTKLDVRVNIVFCFFGQWCWNTVSDLLCGFYISGSRPLLHNTTYDDLELLVMLHGFNQKRYSWLSDCMFVVFRPEEGKSTNKKSKDSKKHFVLQKYVFICSSILLIRFIWGITNWFGGSLLYRNVRAHLNDLYVFLSLQGISDSLFKTFSCLLL